MPKGTSSIQKRGLFLTLNYIPLGGIEMKQIILCFILAVASSALMADTTDIRDLFFDGSADYQEVNLSTEKTRTEYRTIQVPSTCYRSVVRRVCYNRPRSCRRVCDRNGNCRRVCSGGGRVCRDEVRQIPYRCMRTETRAYEVHDYYVETNVKFQFNTADVAQDAAENFKVRVVGETPSLSVKSSKNYIIVLDKEGITSNRQGGVKYVDLVYKINFIPTAQLNSVLGNGIRKVKLRKGVLNFHLGAGFNFDKFSQKIRIFRNRRLGSDVLLLNKFLTANEANVQSTASSSILTVDLNSLGIKLPSKMRVILDTEYKIDENTVLNKSDLKLDASANWIFR